MGWEEVAPGSLMYSPQREDMTNGEKWENEESPNKGLGSLLDKGLA